MTQLDIDGKRAKWIPKLIEFDIEVNPTNLVKGKLVTKIMAEENCDLFRMNFIGISSSNLQTKVAVEEEKAEAEVV